MFFSKKYVLSLFFTTLITAPYMAAGDDFSVESADLFPARKVKEGSQSLRCIGIKWKDKDKYASSSKCNSVAMQVASFYRKNSRGLYQIRPSGSSVSVPYAAARKNLNKAEQYAMSKFKGFDLYAIPNFIMDFSHAGRNLAHLENTLYRTAQHEVGHLLGLAHAGAYRKEKGKMVLDPYGDGLSVMGKYPSGTLTAPQLYYMGWLPKSEVALYEPGKTYTLKKPTNESGEGLSTVIVPPSYFASSAADGSTTPAAGQRYAFISYSTKCTGTYCLVLHLAIPGGSQRVAIFGKEYFDEDFTGLHIRTLKTGDGTMQISIDTASKPADITEGDMDVQDKAIDAESEAELASSNEGMEDDPTEEDGNVIISSN